MKQEVGKHLIEEIKNNPQEYICGHYKIGRYAWILEDIPFKRAYKSQRTIKHLEL